MCKFLIKHDLLVLSRLFLLIILIKVMQLIFFWFSPSQFDTSSELLLEEYESSKIIFINNISKFFKINKSFLNYVLDHYLKKFVVWDSVYFSDLFINEKKFEHHFVWSTGWIFFIKKVIRCGKDNFHSKLILSIFFSNLFHVLSIILLYFYTIQFFSDRSVKKEKQDKYLKKLAEKTCIIAILFQSNGFQISNYSENISIFTTLISLYFYNKSIEYVGSEKKKTISNPIYYILSGLFSAMAFMFRSNLLFLGIIYLKDLIDFVFSKKLQKFPALLSILAGSQILISYLIRDVTATNKFCTQKHDWCQKLLPSLYLHVQKKYWNVGFLKYWTKNNIANFLITIPIIGIYTLSIFHHIKEKNKKIKQQLLIIIDIVTLINGILFWNVQILNRILNAIPTTYWYLAEATLIYDQSDSKKKNKKIIFIRRAIKIFFTWNLIQTILFATFMPPA